nr:MAG TPA: hypothetical protein [Caudoviricetes sp.]
MIANSEVHRGSCQNGRVTYCPKVWHLPPHPIDAKSPVARSGSGVSKER